jgi:cellobiose phosphorylase
MVGRSSVNLKTPKIDDLHLIRAANASGLTVSVLPNGAIFALEHVHGDRRTLINQVLGSPIAGAMGRLFLRTGGAEPATVSLLAPRGGLRLGSADDRIVWETEEKKLHCQACLWLHPDLDAWIWRVHVENRSRRKIPCDAVLVQDLGLGGQGFLMGNEAYASQYLDHFVARHKRAGFVLMTRQNLSQDGGHPWTAHGCLEGAVGFATDYRDALGPGCRDSDQFPLAFGKALPSSRLQYETACAALQSNSAILAPGGETSWTFFGVFKADHPDASSKADLSVADDVERALAAWVRRPVASSVAVRSLVADAPAMIAAELEQDKIRLRYPKRLHVERARGRTLSFFTADGPLNRHVVLRDKERMVWRRHGAILRSGGEMAPTESLLSVTCWMHGVFGAQLTIGNTSFHKLFSVSRDPLNITRGSGLRILVDLGEGWRLLTIPSAFEMGVSDCRWIYKLANRTVSVSAQVAADDPAVLWRVTVDGKPCRLLILGHLVLGEHEFGHRGRVEINPHRKQFAFRPDPKDGLWGQRYPHAVYRLVTSTPDSVDAIGGDELLYADGKRRSGGYAAIRTLPTREFAFAVVGSLTAPKVAEALAAKYARSVDDAAMRAEAEEKWRNVSRNLLIRGAKGEAKAVDTIIPWLVHDAMIHLTVPHGLEQYTGAAWGVRDVCQGPLELLLSLEHDEPAKDILRTVFAQQYEVEGDWPQWFMLEPYSAIQDKHAHGDVIVWPLKALCDYLEATGDLGFLNENIPWRREDTFERTERSSSVADHVDKLLETVRRRFIPGTRLIRYGNGDWNDALQPVDPEKRDWMASSWTVALLYQQVRRYAAALRRLGKALAADPLDALADAMRTDFNRFLIRDGVVAGYGVFNPKGGPPDLLLHPRDRRTGLSYSLIPMTQAIIGGLFTADQAKSHLEIIRKRLVFPDGARLMDQPLAYHGGVETIFRRAESAAFFGREIGLMYVHAHLRYAESLSVMGKRRASWDALLVANPIASTDRLSNASLRQRNAYFSSSDAGFRDRYQASAEWSRVRKGAIAVDGGWRVYSSGPGMYLYLLIQHAFGLQRRFGERIVEPGLPAAQKHLRLEGLPPNIDDGQPHRRRRVR